ncbi:hypothetical protein BDP27DRAFT_1440633 [Rhodocollybia butyracea]|uniref:Uncharacterized protein n=1 Tax=Rhodocollybia butyracea TaxID=206335 RepID=A0A9P5P459_9AGAR|nr:hypothetical protein BDP27DRAFT_1440633 [Rhodocollybia butyracea]
MSIAAICALNGPPKQHRTSLSSHSTDLLIDKLERVTNCIRVNSSWFPLASSQSAELDSLLDHFLSLLCADLVLPAKKNVPPNVSTARETAATMRSMPTVKITQKSKVDGGAYGGGKNSGLKSNSKSRKVVPPSLPIQPSSSSIPIPMPQPSTIATTYSLPYYPFSFHFPYPYLAYQSV